MNRSEQATDISAAITSIHRVSYERVLSSIDTVVRESFVASVMRFDVPPAEQFVVRAGDGDAVIRLYDATELSLETALRAAVERTTGRRVLAFQSSMNPEHGILLETFLLTPERR